MLSSKSLNSVEKYLEKLHYAKLRYTNIVQIVIV